MSYIVTKTDGTTLTTIIDGTKDDTSSSLTLIGRNYSNYGEFVANDFIRLLENFSADNAPPYPLEGQIWWKKNDNLLQVYNGAEWRSVTHVTAASFAYTTTLAGDVWWDTTDQQLHVYNGTSPYAVSGWILVGPSYSSRFGKSGALWESIQDSSNVTHHVLIMYLDNLVTGIISTDSEFTPDIAIPGFITIKRGYNVRSADVFNGTATNATLFDNLATTKFFRNDIDNVTTGNLVVQNNTGLTIGATRQLKINMNGIDASITNSASNGDLNVYVNVDGTSTRALYIEGSTGTIEVAGDPITSPGIATKNYVDKQFVNTTFYGVPMAPTMPAGTANTSIATTAFTAAANVVMRGYVDSIHPLKANIANPVFVGVPMAPTMPAGTANTSIATTDFVSSANIVMRGYVDSIDTLKANIASPTFTGIPRSVTPATGDNSSNIATSAFVYAANLAMTGYVSSLASSTTGGLALKANIAGPVFTGVPYCTDTPAAGDNDKKIATTEYVDRANTVMRGYVDSIQPLKANISSPAFTGVPTTASTPSVGDNTTKLATTAFVATAISNYSPAAPNLTGYAPLANPAFTGVPTAPTASANNSTIQIATTKYVTDAISTAALGGQVDLTAYAPITSPAFQGVPTTATSPADGDNTTKLATTAFVKKAITDALVGGDTPVVLDTLQSTMNITTWLQLSGAAGSGVAVWKIDDDAVLTGNKNGLFLKGLPTAPTMPQSTSGNLSIATTAYVHTATEKWAGSAKTISTAEPSGGVDGDIWFKYSA